MPESFSIWRYPCGHLLQQWCLYPGQPKPCKHSYTSRHPMGDHTGPGPQTTLLGSRAGVISDLPWIKRISWIRASARSWSGSKRRLFWVSCLRDFSWFLNFFYFLVHVAISGEQESNLLIGFHLINCPLGSANVQCSRNRTLASSSEFILKTTLKGQKMLLRFWFQKYCDYGVQETMLQTLWHGMYIYPLKIMRMLFGPAFF